MRKCRGKEKRIYSVVCIKKIGIYNVFVLYLECFENLAINYKVNEAGIVVGILCFSSHKRERKVEKT